MESPALAGLNTASASQRGGRPCTPLQVYSSSLTGSFRPGPLGPSGSDWQLIEAHALKVAAGLPRLLNPGKPSRALACESLAGDSLPAFGADRDSGLARTAFNESRQPDPHTRRASHSVSSSSSFIIRCPPRETSPTRRSYRLASHQQARTAPLLIGPAGCKRVHRPKGIGSDQGRIQPDRGAGSGHPSS
jgi:hypothetical protein